MVVQPSVTGLPPPAEAVAPPPAAPELLWAERAAGVTGPLLVATENGRTPEGAVRLAEALARRHRVNLHVLASVQPTGSFVARLVSSLSGLRSDEFVPSISRTASRRDAKYLLTDLARADDPTRLSTAVRALRLARTSGKVVLAVPPTTEGLPRSALVCTDFTEAGTRAALAAAPLLADGGELTLAHIAPPLDHTEDPEWVRSWNLWATNELRNLADRLGRQERLRVYILLLRGNAESVVARSAPNFDLVALGAPAEDESPLRPGSSLLGAVLRHAATTVLLAPDPARNLQIDPVCPGPLPTAAGSSTR
jgi:hypothetical protein